MTTASVTGLDLLRTRMSGAIGAQMPGHLQRLGWSAEQLAVFLRAGVDGRTDDLFRYGGTSVHPFVIGAVLARAPAVREFQVRQTDRGADVCAVLNSASHGACDAAAGLADLVAEVEDGLRRAGLPAPQVTIRSVAALDRDPLTGKARRFVPRPANQ
jgi:phenylacetate-coenzyme A ligase PaaK-like adenylate-forming protein